jgi:hypothetical protein
MGQTNLQHWGVPGRARHPGQAFLLGSNLPNSRETESSTKTLPPLPPLLLTRRGSAATPWTRPGGHAQPYRRLPRTQPQTNLHVYCRHYPTSVIAVTRSRLYATKPLLHFTKCHVDDEQPPAVPCSGSPASRCAGRSHLWSGGGFDTD